MRLDIARWQFAFTSVNHFFFVPVTIGLALLTAILQTVWVRGKRPEMLRLTRFFGVLLLINVAVGVVSGIVQEFEFGMAWSSYSRLVGNVFGPPLAMEGLAAFFLESTFLGLWIFGWDRLSRGVHLFCIWAVAAGAVISAAFIMAANSWMQHPVGYVMDPATHQPRLTSIVAVMTNPVFLWSYAHVLLASLVTGAAVMLAVSAWQLRRGGDKAVFTVPARLSLIVLTPAVILTMLVGSELGVIEAKYQPMKIAAAEAQWTTCQPCSFSLFQIGGGSNDQVPTQLVSIPHLLSLLATNSWDGKVTGLTPLQRSYAAKYGPGNYVPNVFVQYWSMRVMAYASVLVFALGLWGLWLLRRRRLATSPKFLWLATWAVVLPFVMNTTGWLLTEVGRQPWIVQGIQLTSKGLSPSVSTTDFVIGLAVLVIVYGALAVVDLILMLRYSRRELAGGEGEAPGQAPAPAMLY